MNQCDLVLSRVKGAHGRVSLSLYLDNPGVLRKSPRNDVHQRTFPGAVFSDKSVNLTLSQGEIQARERDRLSERFTYLTQFQNWHLLFTDRRQRRNLHFPIRTIF